MSGRSGRTSRRIITITLAAAVATLAARLWSTYEWRSGERIRYAWALRAWLEGTTAWGRPPGERPAPDWPQLERDADSAARYLNVLERQVIGFRVRRQARRS